MSHRPHHVPGPPRGPVTGDSVPQGRSDDGTAWRFVLRRGACVARFPGERSLSLGTPGLHEESPLGFGHRGTDTSSRKESRGLHQMQTERIRPMEAKKEAVANSVTKQLPSAVVSFGFAEGSIPNFEVSSRSLFSSSPFFFFS